MSETWLRITTEENAIDFLEKTAEFCQRADNYKWKWVCISLHAALYAFAVCALKGTNPDEVAKVSQKKGNWKRELIGFPEAIKRCEQEAKMRWWPDSKVLKLSDDERWAINKLHKTFRNPFMHYLPTLWSIEVSGMPQIVKHVSRVIRFLALESGNLRQLPTNANTRIRKALGILDQAKQ